MSSSTDYEDVLSISKFLGINRASDGHNTDLSYAYDGKNFDTSLGGFKPYGKSKRISDNPYLRQEYEPVPGAEALMFMSKRYQDNSGIVGISDSESNRYAVLAICGKLYYRHTVYGTYDNTRWTEIKDDDGQSFSFAGFSFDWVTYELNYAPPETLTSTIVTDIYTNGSEYYTFSSEDYKYYLVASEDGESAKYTDSDGEEHTLTVGTDIVRKAYTDAPVDCVLMTNKDDGLYCVYAPIEGDALKCVKITVQPSGSSECKFDCIALHNERVWGGAMPADNDKVMYSAPNDPFNWEANTEIPEDGAGDIQQPEWNGDSVVALKSFGGYLVMFKKHSIWRMSGTSPDSYSWVKAYGDGTISEETIAIYNGSIFFVGNDYEIKTFDGSSVSTYKYATAHGLLHDNPNDDIYVPDFARIVGDKYFVHVAPNFLIYNLSESTLCMCSCERGLFMETDGEKLYTVRFRGDDTLECTFVDTYELFGDAYECTTSSQSGQRNLPVTWESAWQDLGAKNILKSGFIVYLTPELQDGYSASVYKTPFTCTVTITTEKKSKSKTVTIPVGKCKRIHLNVSGRQFKLKFEMPADSTHNLIPWKLATGVQIYTEYDYD